MRNSPKIEKHPSNSSCTRHFSPLLVKLCMLAVIVLVALIISNAASAQYTDIKRLGTSQAICKKPGVQTAEELQVFFAENADIVGEILSDAAWQGDTEKLFDAIKNGDFEEKVYPVGTTFEWMGMRKNKQAIASPMRRWAGETSFSGFEVTIRNACVDNQIVIPKICCNIALAASTEVETNPSLEIVAGDRSLRVCTDNTSDIQLFLTGPDGASSGLSIDNSGCWYGDMLEPGDYTVKVTAECGETSETVSIGEANRAVEHDKPLTKKQLVAFIAAFAGTETLMRLETAWNMEMRDSSGIAGLRGGLKVPLTRSLTLVPSIGALHRNGVNDGNVYPDETVFADIGLEANISKNFFVGAGVGVWDANDGDFREESIFINASGPITPISEWFVEARGIDSDNPDGNDGFSDNRSFNVGVRLLFR